MRDAHDTGAEAAALRRLALAAAADAPLEDVLDAVVSAAAACFGDVIALVVRYDAGRRGRIVAADGCGGRLRALPRAAFDVTAWRDAAAVAPIAGPSGTWGALLLLGVDGAPAPDGDDGRLGVLADLVALTLRRAETRRTLVAQATTDGLTGLSNRRCFEQRLAQEIARAQRHSLALSVAMLDLDGFKSVNDTWGHAAGDRLLVGVGEVLRRAVRAEATVARVGGDEFALILPETDAEQTPELERRIAEALRAVRCPAGRGLVLSAGFAQWQPGMDAAALCEAADLRLYAAKRGRRPAPMAPGAPH
jgi:diguanylate cyclase (GGDEF)-like protein